MIGKVPDTIADRSIVVHMTRKLTTETREPLSELNPASIKAKCARFALDARQTIAQSEKIRDKNLNDRAADTYDPLYAIARLAGKEWEEKLHAAAIAISPGAGSKSTGAEMLLDIYAIFLSTGRRQIFTRELAEFLRNDEFNTTCAVLKDSALDEYKISELLRAYGIKPAPCRLGKTVSRGYRIDDFVEALKRYVPKADLDARTAEVERQEKLFEEAEEFAEQVDRLRVRTGEED